MTRVQAVCRRVQAVCSRVQPCAGRVQACSVDSTQFRLSCLFLFRELLMRLFRESLRLLITCFGSRHMDAVS